jgi:purine-binding chemotaxis protein CheW
MAPAKTTAARSAAPAGARQAAAAEAAAAAATATATAEAPAATQPPQDTPAATGPKQATATASGSCQLVVFSLAGDEYALPIDAIQEVIRYTRPRNVMSPDPWVTGVVDLRGKIVPVCDLAARLGVARSEHEDRKIVILETMAGTAGMIVDAVDQVILVQNSQLEFPPSADPGTVHAIARLDERLVVVLNAERLVSSTSYSLADQRDEVALAA